MSPPDPRAVCRKYGLQMVRMLVQNSEGFAAQVRTDDGNDCILKWSIPLIGIEEAACLQAWHATGLTPQVIAELEPHLYLRVWVAGASLADLPPGTSIEARQIGRALRRLHAVPAPWQTPDFRDSFAWLGGSWEHLPPKLRRLAEDLTATLGATSASTCHRACCRWST